MDKVNAKIGTDYKLFNYYGAADAEHIIISKMCIRDRLLAAAGWTCARSAKP